MKNRWLKKARQLKKVHTTSNFKEFNHEDLLHLYPHRYRDRHHDPQPRPHEGQLGPRRHRQEWQVAPQQDPLLMGQRSAVLPRQERCPHLPRHRLHQHLHPWHGSSAEDPPHLWHHLHGRHHRQDNEHREA